MTAYDEYQRACVVHRQWLATARVTRNPAHFELAATTQRIAEEWRARVAAERSLRDLQVKGKRMKEEVYA